MSAARLGPCGVAALAVALGEPAVLGRYAAKVVRAPGSACWWTGAVSGRGHGRIWLSAGRVAIAHRFAFATVHGIDLLVRAEMLGDRCDNPLLKGSGDSLDVTAELARLRHQHEQQLCLW